MFGELGMKGSYIIEYSDVEALGHRYPKFFWQTDVTKHVLVLEETVFQSSFSYFVLFSLSPSPTPNSVSLIENTLLLSPSRSCISLTHSAHDPSFLLSLSLPVQFSFLPTIRLLTLITLDTSGQPLFVVPSTLLQHALARIRSHCLATP